MKKSFLYACFCGLLLLTSCATASLSGGKGVGRVKRYDFYSYDLPQDLDGFKIGFAADFHYESRFTRKRLSQLVGTLQEMNADVLLLGGDYIGRNGGDMDTLFAQLAQVKTPYGTYGVMGNHEWKTDEVHQRVIASMKRYGVVPMENEAYRLMKGDTSLVICGVKNPFDLKHNVPSPSESFDSREFVVLVTHTPDYIEDTSVANANLVLAGHTHGGQVSLFRSYTPAHFSKYGNRFLTGLKKNSQGVPIIITNGIGTSRKDIRLFTPSEVVLIVLHRVE